jgi:hypothetical protein
MFSYKGSIFLGHHTQINTINQQNTYNNAVEGASPRGATGRPRRRRARSSRSHRRRPELAHEALQQRAEAAPRRVELEQCGRLPAHQRRRKRTLLHVPAVRLRRRGSGVTPPEPRPMAAACGGGGWGGEVAGNEEALSDGADGIEEPGELEVTAGAWLGVLPRCGAERAGA